MGGCNSCEATAVAAGAAGAGAGATAKVVLADGRLQELAGPARASQVLQRAGACGLAVCSADDVELGERVAAVGPDEELQPGQLYFLLPAPMLRRRLRAEDMAELALRASAALACRRCKGPLLFPASRKPHLAGRPDNNQDDGADVPEMTIAGRKRRAGSRGGAKGSDFASQLTAIHEE